VASFTVQVIDAKGKEREVKATMRFGVYNKQYYGDKLIALFENLAGAERWIATGFPENTVYIVPLTRDPTDHVHGHSTTPTANLDMMKS
jgi:hypothetical protein